MKKNPYPMQLTAASIRQAKAQAKRDEPKHVLYRGYDITTGKGGSVFVGAGRGLFKSLKAAKAAVDTQIKMREGYANNPGKRAKKNPAEEAAQGYRDFHGEDPKEMVKVTSTVHFHRHLSGAGELEYLVIDTTDGKYRTTVKFKKDVLLAFNEKRNQLFIEGGDQSVDLKDFGIDSKDAHELETLGKATRIGYFTNKAHLSAEDGGEAIYDHKFRMTNENGRHVTVRVAKYPDVIYRVRDQHLEFSGGSYKILPEGIDK